jgi:hypothetical protein
MHWHQRHRRDGACLAESRKDRKRGVPAYWTMLTTRVPSSCSEHGVARPAFSPDGSRPFLWNRNVPTSGHIGQGLRNRDVPDFVAVLSDRPVRRKLSGSRRIQNGHAGPTRHVGICRILISLTRPVQPRHGAALCASEPSVNHNALRTDLIFLNAASSCPYYE